MKRALTLEPEQWQWSSYRSYAYNEQGRAKINQWPKAWATAGGLKVGANLQLLEKFGTFRLFPFFPKVFTAKRDRLIVREFSICYCFFDIVSFVAVSQEAAPPPREYRNLQN